MPGKALNILKYVAVGLGIIESVLETRDQEAEIRDQKDKDQVKINVEETEVETDKEEVLDET